MKKYLEHRVLALSFFIDFLFVVFAFLWGYVRLKDASGPIILHYDNYVGIDFIGGMSQLMWVAALSAVIVITNFFIAAELEARNKFLSRVVASITAVMAVLIFIGFAAIISVN